MWLFVQGIHRRAITGLQQCDAWMNTRKIYCLAFHHRWAPNISLNVIITMGFGIFVVSPVDHSLLWWIWLLIRMLVFKRIFKRVCFSASTEWFCAIYRHSADYIDMICHAVIKGFGHVFVDYGPLTIYVKLRVAHAPGMPKTFTLPPTSNKIFSLQSRHASRHVLHARAVMHIGIANPRWRGKPSRHSRRMGNQQFDISGTKLIQHYSRWPRRSHEISRHFDIS